MSVNYIEDIHPLTLAELKELAKYSDRFALHLRVSHGIRPEDRPPRHDLVIAEKVRSEVFERIYVCGPPNMSKEMTNIFDNHSLDPFKFMIL